MNLKVANLVGVQFGIFVGIMAWLAYSHFESVEPRNAAERQERPMNAVAALASISDLGSQISSAPDDDDGAREQDQSTGEQPALAVPPHQYSPEAAQQYALLASQQYYQQIAPRRYVSSPLTNTSVAPVPRVHAEVAPEPAAVSSDYVEPVQTVVYVQPAPIIVFSNSGRFANRSRPTPHLNGARGPNIHRRSDQEDSRPREGGVGPRENAGPPSCPPAQGFKHRETRQFTTARR